ncbi:hypothetical protein Droror1_Dr00000896 [Drosera rotundifolia]
MADISSTSRHTRLQRRAPSLIQTTRSSSSSSSTWSEWNVAIPLLSPIASSRLINRPYKQKMETEYSRQQSSSTAALNKWLHPAGPFYYEPETALAPLVIRLDGS